MAFYIRVAEVDILDALYSFIEAHGIAHLVKAQRQHGYFLLTTEDAALWRDLFLYAQIIAQDQDSLIDGGEFTTQH
jgi:hypothetical protein